MTWRLAVLAIYIYYGYMLRDVFEDLARIAYPAPRPDEVDPPEAFDDVAAEVAHRREDYAENLRTRAEATDTDPLLAELQGAAQRRDDGAAHVRSLLAYGRHYTGSRPDYTWEALAEAAGLPYSTARRMVTSHAVTALDQILDSHPLTQAPVWINPPRRDAEHDNVLFKLSQRQVALLVDTLRAAIERTSETHTARELGDLVRELTAARESPNQANQQLSRLLPDALRQATRELGPQHVVDQAIEITAALAYDRGGEPDKAELLSGVRATMDRAAQTSYPGADAASE